MSEQPEIALAPAPVAAGGGGPAPLDRDLARALAGQVTGQHRLVFAQSFTFAVMQAWRETCCVAASWRRPAGVELIALSSAALAAAQRLGAGLAGLAPRAAAHLAGAIYTAALPDAYRATNGIFYTPPPLVDRLLEMADSAGVDWSSARVLDPSCGGGAFLLPVAQRMVAAAGRADPAVILRQLGARLHGFELDRFGAWLAQAAFELALRDVIAAAGRPAPQIVDVRDSLDMRPAEYGRFDLVIGNPPYGRVTPDRARRTVFRRSVYGHANLYGLFTDAALHWARPGGGSGQGGGSGPGGVIAYVTPTSMLSGLYYKALRGLLAAAAPPVAVNFVSERQGVFADVLQETILATYRRGGTRRTAGVGFITIDAAGTASACEAGTFALPSHPHAPWLLPRAPGQAALARRLGKLAHRLADYGYGVSTGPLVWNRFKDQFRQERRAGCYPVIWAESVTSAGNFVWRSEKRNHAPWFEARLPRDNWLIVTQPCVLLQRTTAKEQARRLIAAEMSAAFLRRHRGVIVENHLNMVRAIVPQPGVPAAVIAALLGSATVDAAFRCINGSVAVSAFELEALPLPPPSVMADLAALVAAGAPARQIEAVIAAAYAGDDAATAA
jgi:adenine-specific DNA-methyltransferase